VLGGAFNPLVDFTIFITGFAENAAIAHGQLDSGMYLIAKPFIMAAFANTVAEIIEV
jgi:hypothetical protein